jgi:hypothetical protein
MLLPPLAAAAVAAAAGGCCGWCLQPLNGVGEVPSSDGVATGELSRLGVWE